jgi:hypothetical protein
VSLVVGGEWQRGADVVAFQVGHLAQDVSSSVMARARKLPQSETVMRRPHARLAAAPSGLDRDPGSVVDR